MSYFDLLKHKVSSFKKKLLFNLLLKSSSFFLILLISTFLILNYIEYFLYLPSISKTIIVFAYFLTITFLLIKQVILPVKNYINYDNSISDQIAAKTIGANIPEIKDKLLNTIQLKSVDNQSLASASLDQRAFSLQNFNFDIALKKDENKQIYYLLIIPVILLIFTSLYNINILFEGSQRLLDFNKSYQPPSPFQIQLLNRSLKAYKDEPFEINFEINGNLIPENVYVEINGIKRKAEKKNENTYSYRLSSVNQPAEFSIVSSGYSSEKFNIELIERPYLVEGNITVRPPAYLKQETRVLQNLSNITVPEGSNITWHFKTGATEFLEFSIDSSVFRKTTEETNSISFEEVISKNTPYGLTLKNKYSENIDKLYYQVNVIKDKHPSVNLNSVTDTSMFSYIILNGTIEDDYGFNRLVLKYRINDSQFNSIYLDINKNQPHQNYTYYWNLDTLKLNKEDELEYYVQVWDNDGFNGSKSNKSFTKKFKLPDFQEIEDKINKESNKFENSFEDVLKQLKEQDQKLESLDENLKTKKKLDWQDKKNIEDQLKQHQNIQENIKKLNEKFQELNKAKEKLTNQSERIKEKSEKLEKLMNELLDEETKKLYDELQKLLNENKPNDQDIKDALEELNKKDFNLEKELERALQLLKQFQLQKETEQLAQKLEDLAKKEDVLKNKTENKSSDNESLKKEQGDINKAFDEVKEDIKKLDGMNKELNNKSDEFQKNTSEDQKSIEESLKESSEQLEKNNNKKASESQKNSSEQMRKMSEKLMEMAMSGEMEQMGEDLKTIRNILENLVKLSFDQEELMDKFKTIKTVNPQFVEHSTSQIKIKNDSKIIEDSLLALAGRNFQVEAFITDELFEMNDKIDKSLEAIRDREISKITVNQHLAMTSMNNLALLLSDVSEQMQQQMAQQMPGNQNCNKPSNKPGGKKLSLMQMELNKKISELKKSGKSGQQLSEDLAKLAAEQEAIREAMKEAEKGNKPGDSGKLEELMEETEKDLVNKRLLDMTLMRQEEILSRLLKSEKATRERELDEKREAQQAKNKYRDLPPDIQEYLREKEKQTQLLKNVSPDYSPYYKKEIKEYFENETNIN